MKTLFFLMSLILTTSCSFAIEKPLDVVQHVDLERYLGTWYEIARFDQSFQKGCTATTATYSKMKNGDIEVLNQCRKNSPDGKLKKAIGRAWVTDHQTNAKLRVQFFLSSIKLNFLSGNYWIIDLDEDYQYAVIGDPTRQYLWILSRTPRMDESLFTELTAKAKAKGFDISKLLITEH